MTEMLLRKSFWIFVLEMYMNKAFNKEFIFVTIQVAKIYVCNAAHDRRDIRTLKYTDSSGCMHLID